MAQRSNGYILGFATAVCVVCSVFVSGAALSLKDKQVANAELDLKKNVISVSGLKSAGADGQLVITPEDVDTYFKKDAADRVELGYVELKSGKLTDTDTVTTYRSANKGKCEDLPAKENIAKVSCLPKYKEVFTVYKNNSVDRIILNVEGKGLWSTLYGFLALSKDGSTINGLTFYKHAETPGLGGEVDNPKWKKLWEGEQAFKSGKPQIDIVKGAAPSGVSTDGKIDGLSGATLTSNGVEYLLNFWLGDNGYGPYVKTLSKGS
jgi:Na+-transporting NADH:ubiquinone oxidoreductase subunit C